jgi:hypothetical protein
MYCVHFRRDRTAVHMPQLASATLALLVTLFLSACGSGSSCGGGSGYQVDGVPGLLSCSSSGGTTSSGGGSATTVDPNSHSQLSSDLAISVNGAAMPYYVPFSSSSVNGLTLTLNQPTGNITGTNESGTTQTYSLTVSGTGPMTSLWCRIQDDSNAHYGITNVTTPGSVTVSVSYPMFSTAASPPYVFECYGFTGGTFSSASTAATVTGS